MSFWETSTEEEKRILLNDVLTYANSNTNTFRKDIKEIQFDIVLSPLPVILEALSKDTERWGDFYVEVLRDIFEHAKKIKKPQNVLTFISEFYYIEGDTRPFVQKIVNILSKEIDSENIAIKLKAICTLPSYLRNPSIKNKNLLIKNLTEKLHDKNWKVRYVSFKSLGYENLLPKGSKLSYIDLLLKTFLGESETL